MRIIRDSSLREYAIQFWQREALKNDVGRAALADFANGGDPVEWLSNHFDYKLPCRDNRDSICVALLDREEVEELLIHAYMPCGEWMQKQGLVPDPYTRKLKELATIALARGYFSRGGDDTQQKNIGTGSAKDRSKMRSPARKERLSNLSALANMRSSMAGEDCLHT